MIEDDEVLIFTEHAGGPCQDPRTMGYHVLRQDNDCVVESWQRFSPSPPTNGQPYPDVGSKWQQIGRMSASQFENGVLGILKQLDWEERYSVSGFCDGGGWSVRAHWGAYEFESSGYVAKPEDYDDARERIIYALQNQGAEPNAKILFARIRNRLFSKRQETPSTTAMTCRRCIHCYKELPPFSKYCPTCGSYIGKDYLVEVHEDSVGSARHDDSTCSGKKVSGTRPSWAPTVTERWFMAESKAPWTGTPARSLFDGGDRKEMTSSSYSCPRMSETFTICTGLFVRM